MDAFEKWADEHGYSIMDRRPDDSKHPRYPAIQTEAAWQAWQFAFRAGMRRAAEICRDRSTILEPGNTDHTEEGGCYECGAEEEADYLANAILAEADKP